jgi:hypothetical protein
MSVRNSSICTRFKKHQLAIGLVYCQGCLWEPPPLVRDSWELLRSHHIIPVAAGGFDGFENMILLCPTCHLLVHRMFSFTGGTWNGPTTALETRRALQSVNVALMSMRIA